MYVGAGPVSAHTLRARRNNGITLIALIITIIVMLILVGVTITVAVNGGLFEYAGRAGRETNQAIMAEQELANGRIKIDEVWYDSIEDYINKKPSENQEDGTAGGGTGEVVIPETFSEIYNENTPITQGSYTAMIPKGFAVGTSEGIDTIADGLVIQDAQGNQFVWIPVNYTATGTLDGNGLDSGFLSVFYRSEWANNARTTGLSTDFTEPYADGYTTPEGKTESEEYYEMMRSVQENKGFYIGRYEAGSTTARTNKTNGTTQMVVKRDAYPYIYVGWGSSMSNYTEEITYSSKNQGKGAVLLSKELYGKAEDAGKYGVVSTLCYGIQWDAMLDFVKDSNHHVTSSTTWGNCGSNPWTITRTTARYTTSPNTDTTWNLIDNEENDKKEKTSSESILLTTGASDSFAAKNIFDVAGNVMEWTNEANSSTYRVGRGGYFFYDIYVSDHPASYRYNNTPYYCNNLVGFRPALYITNE